MPDLAVLAIGFGITPFAAVVLYPYRNWIAAHPAIVWGMLAGVVAFLGLSHAMAWVLVEKPFLFGGSVLGSTAFLLAGLSMGGVLGWAIFGGRFVRAESSRVVWASAAFLGVHSAGDGIILGHAFAGAALPIIPIDAVTISATAAHRLIEGALVLVPVMAAASKWRPSFLVPMLGALLAIPAAYMPGVLTDMLGFVSGNATSLAVSTFLAAIESVFALFLLARGILPIASARNRMAWIVWTSIGFIGISGLHFLVE